MLHVKTPMLQFLGQMAEGIEEGRETKVVLFVHAQLLRDREK